MSGKKPDTSLLYEQASDAIRQLAELAAASPECSSAACSLHALAHEAVEKLGHVASLAPDALRPIAETSAVWPAFISPHRDFDRSNRELMDLLNLGSRHWLRTSEPAKRRGKRWSFRTDANRMAINAIRELEGHRLACRTLSTHSAGSPRLTKKIRSLKPLTTATAPLWFEVWWQAIVESTNRHPERDPRLRRLGFHKATHTVTSPKGSRASESNIRDAIKDRLRVAFNTVLSDTSQFGIK